MPGAVVRISDHARRELRRLAEKSGRSMLSVLDDAIETYRRQVILEESNRAYAALRRNPKAWKEEVKERKIWDRALMDGLEESRS